MDKVRKTFSKRFARFAVVGIANAAISFGLLNFSFYVLHTNKILSSIISTSCALLFSFALNRHFVFADKSSPAHKQAVPFVIVTVLGSFVILNLVYIGCLAILKHHGQWLVTFIRDITTLKLDPNFVDINTSTVVGAIVAMVWNYEGYKRFVFKTEGHGGRQNEQGQKPTTDSRSSHEAQTA